MNVIEAYLARKQMKPALLAGMVKVRPSTITRLINGERNASPELAIAIEQATNGGLKAIDILAMALRPKSIVTATEETA